MEISIDDVVKIRLTSLGFAIHRADFDASGLAEHGFKYRKPETDNEGFSEFLLWDVMRIFGPHIGLGKEVPFHTTIVFEE